MEPTHVFEQHPVPQHISSYQFRLVGDMTLKQFLELAGGAGVALLFYASPLPAFLKWPFVAFFALAGAALAFLPIQDRPLEQWVAAFFRSIYSPTLLYWTKTATPPKYFADRAPTQAPSSTAAASASGPLEAFTQNLEEAEHALLGTITGLFRQDQAAPTPSTPPPPQPAPAATGQVPEKIEPQPGIIYESPIPPSENKLNVVKAPKKEVIAPHEARIATEKKGFQTPTPDSTPSHNGIAQPIAQTLPEQKLPTSTAPQPIAGGVPPPLPPSQPNIIVGQVLDNTGAILESAILEIKDPLGRPVRALKTNKTGHFMIVTPLANGKYELLTEKDGFSFAPLAIEAKGHLIPPIIIKAK